MKDGSWWCRNTGNSTWGSCQQRGSLEYTNRQFSTISEQWIGHFWMDAISSLHCCMYNKKCLPNLNEIEWTRNKHSHKQPLNDRSESSTKTKQISYAIMLSLGSLSQSPNSQFHYFGLKFSNPTSTEISSSVYNAFKSLRSSQSLRNDWNYKFINKHATQHQQYKTRHYKTHQLLFRPINLFTTDSLFFQRMFNSALVSRPDRGLALLVTENYTNTIWFDFFCV